MHKPSYEEFEDKLAEARASVTPGTTWRHYKGGEYVIADLVVAEHNNELLVIYSPLKRSGISFARPFTEWLDEIALEHGTITRFTQF